MSKMEYSAIVAEALYTRWYLEIAKRILKNNETTKHRWIFLFSDV